MPSDLAVLAEAMGRSGNEPQRVAEWDIWFYNQPDALKQLEFFAAETKDRHEHFLGIGTDRGEVSAVVGWSPGQPDMVYELDHDGAAARGSIGAWLAHLALDADTNRATTGMAYEEPLDELARRLCMPFVKDEEGYQEAEWEPAPEVQKILLAGKHKQWLDMIVPVSVYNKGIRYLVEGKKKVKNAKINVWKTAPDPAGRYVLLSEWGREWSRIDLPSGQLTTFPSPVNVSEIAPLGNDCFACLYYREYQGDLVKQADIAVFSVSQQQPEMILRYPTGLSSPSSLHSIPDDGLVMVSTTERQRSLILLWTGQGFAALGGVPRLLTDIHRVDDRYYYSWFHLPTIGAALAYVG